VFPLPLPDSHGVAMFFRASGPSSRSLLAYDQPLRRSTTLRHFRSSVRRVTVNRTRRALMNSGSPAECNQLVAAAAVSTRRSSPRTTGSHGVLPSSARINPRSPLIPEPATAPSRSACRVSHPLDVFLLLRPTQLYFMPGALMRFTLRGLSLRRAALLSEPLLPCRFESHRQSRRSETNE
jgi:hypothetical protein